MHVHDELILQPVGPRLREVDALGLGGRGAIERPVDLVHRDERRSHAGGGLEEAPARQAVLLAKLVAERIHARFDLLLLLGLRDRQEFVAGDNLGRHRSRFAGQPRRQQPAMFLVAQHAHGGPRGS